MSVDVYEAWLEAVQGALGVAISVRPLSTESSDRNRRIDAPTWLHPAIEPNRF